MERKILVVAILMTAAIGTAVADEHPRWYTGIAIGQSNIETTIVQPSLPPVKTSFDETEDLTKIQFGYKPVKYLAIELGAFGSGEYSSVIGESTPGAGDGFNVSADYFGWDLSILGILPLMDRRIDIYARVGLQNQEINVTVIDQIDPLFSGTRKRICS